ncbi:hypothetical protein NHX12_017474 [Muraenolepis orangiensis]|uniref:C-type lectin domain-containing protein n=1 Tax=Muraenolepis orangiensis TaxID=630683 RepID=A0A9Q0D7I0_9TELE|nr:hypothetical protein NHX12_017474 [Muraenolepis orangiensis]
MDTRVLLGLLFSGPSSAKTYHHVTQQLSWKSAKSYCRTHYTDLAKIENQAENQQVSSNVTTFAWIGLSRDPWTWSDGSIGSFRHWLVNEPDNKESVQFCSVFLNGAMADTHCTHKKQLICMGRKRIRIRIKIHSNFDLTNQEMKDNILLQMAASLASTGNKGFNLSWSVPPTKLEPEDLNHDNK